LKIMAGVESFLHAGLVSIWGEGGTKRIHSAWRERDDALSRFKYSERQNTGHRYKAAGGRAKRASV